MSVTPIERTLGSILLAEDDFGVRKLVSRLLLDSGYHVLEAANGDEALRLSDEYRGSLHLLLSDLRMPGLDGLRLWDRVKRSRPETKALFMSACERPLIQPEVPFLPKPFRAEDLLRAVAGVLDGASCQRGG
jgi:two-component system, cell cycle sensor histidine kinase and response regulator CckA